MVQLHRLGYIFHALSMAEIVEARILDTINGIKKIFLSLRVRWKSMSKENVLFSIIFLLT